MAVQDCELRLAAAHESALLMAEVSRAVDVLDGAVGAAAAAAAADHGDHPLARAAIAALLGDAAARRRGLDPEAWRLREPHSSDDEARALSGAGRGTAFVMPVLFRAQQCLRDALCAL